MQAAVCQLCGGDDPRYLCQVRNDRSLKALGIDPPTSVKVMCGRCGHIYANPQLDDAELTRLYRDLYRSKALGYADERPSETYLYWKTQKADHEYRWIQRQLGAVAAPDDEPSADQMLDASHRPSCTSTS